MKQQTLIDQIEEEKALTKAAQRELANEKKRAEALEKAGENKKGSKKKGMSS